MFRFHFAFSAQTKRTNNDVCNGNITIIAYNARPEREMQRVRML